MTAAIVQLEQPIDEIRALKAKMYYARYLNLCKMAEIARQQGLLEARRAGIPEDRETWLRKECYEVCNGQ